MGNHMKNSKKAMNAAPAGVYTSNVVYREVLQWFFLWVWGSLGSPLDSQFFSRAWALVSSKGTFIYIRHSPMYVFMGDFSKK